MHKKFFAIVFILSFFFHCHDGSKTNLNRSTLEELQAGNQRFFSGHSDHPKQDLETLQSIQSEQHPKVAIVSCSDSRVPPEIILDQGLGDVFSIRTAGNVIGDFELGSVEYAVEHLNVKTVLVLGHKDCGAIKAFLNPDSKHRFDHIQSIVHYIEEEEEEKELIQAHNLNINTAVKANVKHGVHFLQSSEPILKELVQNRKVEIHGAIYDVSSGQIEWLKEDLPSSKPNLSKP